MQINIKFTHKLTKIDKIYTQIIKNTHTYINLNIQQFTSRNDNF